MRLALSLAVPVLLLAVGCSQLTYRPHVAPVVALPRHPLPPEATTYRLVIEGESVNAPRLAGGIVVPKLQRAKSETRTDVKVVIHGPGGHDMTIDKSGGAPPDITVHGQHAGGDVTVARHTDPAPMTEDVVVTVGIGLAEATGLEVKQETSTDALPGLPASPHPVFSYTGTWAVPEELIIVTKDAGEIAAYTDPYRVGFTFARDPRTHLPFLTRAQLEAAWLVAMPALAMKVSQDSVAGFISGANNIIADEFTARSTTIGVDLADEHKQDPRFAEASRAFDAALSSRLSDPAGFAAKLDAPIQIWQAIVGNPPGKDDGDKRSAVGAAEFDLGVARFLLDDLDTAENFILAAQAKGVERDEIRYMQRCISDRRERLAAAAPR